MKYLLLLEKIKSESRTERLLGWKQIGSDCDDLQLTDELIRDLYRIAHKEEDPEVKAEASLTLSEVVQRQLSAAGKKRLRKKRRRKTFVRHKRLAAYWLWDPFREPSIVVSSFDLNHIKRDENAETVIGRRVGFEEFPFTEFHRYQAWRNGWERVRANLEFEPNAVCIVGRVGLFGRKAIAELKDPNSRFSLPTQDGPSGLEIDELFHCVHEKIGYQDEDVHRTERNGSIIKDYAIVQRYPMLLGSGPITVVHIAGAKSLGSLGAAQWAAFNLFQQTGTYDGIPLPEKTLANSRMEALVSVEAEISEAPWKPRIQLERLVIDNRHVWNIEKGIWEKGPLHRISVLIHDDNSYDILFDGQLIQMEECQGKRLLRAAVEQKAETGREILDLELLAADQTIWSKRDGEPNVRGRLQDLKGRWVNTAIRVDRDVRLVKDVEVYRVEKGTTKLVKSCIGSGGANP